jgi:hypothetical protein
MPPKTLKNPLRRRARGPGKRQAADAITVRPTYDAHRSLHPEMPTFDELLSARWFAVAWRRVTSGLRLHPSARRQVAMKANVSLSRCQPLLAAANNRVRSSILSASVSAGLAAVVGCNNHAYPSAETLDAGIASGATSGLPEALTTRRGLLTIECTPNAVGDDHDAVARAAESVEGRHAFDIVKEPERYVLQINTPALCAQYDWSVFGHDSWGTSLRVDCRSHWIQSAGPDRTFCTPDDLALRVVPKPKFHSIPNDDPFGH